MAAVLVTGLLALIALRSAPDSRELDKRENSRAMSRGANGGALPPPPQASMAGADNLGTPVALGEYYVGVYVEPADPALVAQLNIEGGIVVRHVVPGSPAEAAGVKPNDIMLRAGDSPLLVVCSLGAEVNQAGAKEVHFELIRAGKPLSLTMTPSKRPAEIWTPPGMNQTSLPPGADIAMIGEPVSANPRSPSLSSGTGEAANAKIEKLQRELAAARNELESLKAELAAKKSP